MKINDGFHILNDDDHDDVILNDDDHDDVILHEDVFITTGCQSTSTMSTAILRC